MKKIADSVFLLVSLTVSLHVGACAQQVATLYSFTSTSGTYAPITGGTVLGDISVDDDIFTSSGRYTADYATNPEGPIRVGIPIGFTFRFGTAEMTHFGVNANGSITLGTGSTRAHLLSFNSVYVNGSGYESNIGFDNVIYCFQNDLAAKAGSEIRYQLIGTSPARELVVQWKSYDRVQMNTKVGENITFQLRLRETDNQIQIVFGTVTSLRVSPSASAWLVGLRGVGGTDVHLIGGAPSSLSRITNAADLNNYLLVNSSNLPTSGQTLTFSRSTTDVETELAADISDLQAWPTAMTDVLNVRAQVRKADRVELQLVDLSGRVHLTQSIASAGGTAEVQIDISSLAPGFYVMQVGAGSAAKHVKLIKQ